MVYLSKITRLKLWLKLIGLGHANPSHLKK